MALNSPTWLRRLGLAGGILFVAILRAISLQASLATYDAAVTADAAGGLPALARLTSAVTLSGVDRPAFNFGGVSGDATFEFILEGNPSANTSAYLAVGENASSNLRYELWNNTGQLGFTQLGVFDYAFTPGVPSPTQAAHVTYVWDSLARTMKLYLSGHLAGSCANVSPAFAMPRGQGWLGANPQAGEPMVGTIHRLTVYAGRVSEEIILAHADAFQGVVRPPTILSFSASPAVVFRPESATLRWEVKGADVVWLGGVDVSQRSSLIVSPSVTSTYTLVASNAAGKVSAEAIVTVDPPPQIERFVADRSYVRAGETVGLSWQVRFAQSLALAPDIGDVSGRTATNGQGSVSIRPSATTTYRLTVRNAHGEVSASAEVRLVQPANHLVISEFMADDQSTLADEDGEHSGWIEIHNPTPSAVSLAGYSLTDDPSRLGRWAFPATNLSAGGYLVVFASGKNRLRVGSALHANFRLDNDGEYLGLVGPGSTVAHAFAPTFPRQRPDISYGLLSADPALVQYFGVPTPGAPNREELPPPEAVEFSRASGTFAEAFPLALTCPDPSAEIRYTMDGTDPSATKGLRFQVPIQVARTAQVRAVAVLPGRVSPLSSVSFVRLAPELVKYRSSLPILVIENFGAGAIPRKGWNSTGAGIKQVPRQTAVWATFERDGSSSTLTNPPQMLSRIGIRGRGAYSTEWRQKPYSVEVVTDSGEEAKASPLGLPAHADWVLYFPDPEASRDPALLFNTFAYELSRECGRYAARFRWVEAFVNEDGGDLTLADRRGVYALMEKVARGEDRLNFERLSPDGADGGWLLNINRMDPEPDTGWPAPNGATEPWFFHTPGPNRIPQAQPNVAATPVPGDDLPQQWNAFINFDNPNGYKITLAQRSTIEEWFRRFEGVLYDDAVWRDAALGYRRYLDATDFADYFLLNVLTRNGDGLLLSMFPWKGDDGRLRMGPAWDYNWSAYYISGGPTGSLMHRAEQLWYARLFADPDFKQLYIDRWWELRRGAMGNEGMAAIVDRQAAEISPEKALLNGMPSAAEWSRRLTQMKTWLTQRADWIDSNYLRPPTFNRPGGEAPNDFQVVITGSGGVIHFTTDGTDPRAAGGAVAGTATTYAGPIAVHARLAIKARIRNGSNWSGLSTALFSPPATSAADLDADGMPDWQETAAGTDPADPKSVLRFASVAYARSGNLILGFRAVSNRVYSVEYKNDLRQAAWTRLAEVAARSSDRIETVTDPAPRSPRFYRLLTPALP